MEPRTWSDKEGLTIKAEELRLAWVKVATLVNFFEELDFVVELNLPSGWNTIQEKIFHSAVGDRPEVLIKRTITEFF